MYKTKWLNYYFPQKTLILPKKWSLLRAVGREKLSDAAQLKLEWIIFFYTVGKKNVTDTAKHFGISRKTLHKWLNRFDEKNLLTLEEHSREPKGKRVWMVTKEEEAQIKQLRRKYMTLGKKKLQVRYKEEYHEDISTWKIERVIRKHKLYPDPIAHKRQVEKHKDLKPKLRIHTIAETIKEVKEFGFLWHIDAIIIWWYGARIVIFTAIEQWSRIAYARIYKTNTSGYAEDFLKKLNYLVEGEIALMHHDNGSEFKGAFEEACESLGIIQAYSRAYTPKDNAQLERFNRTIQEEWLAFSVQGLDDINEANKDLTEWLAYYNNVRPNQAPCKVK